jgi:hypothetical protein
MHGASTHDGYSSPHRSGASMVHGSYYNGAGTMWPYHNFKVFPRNFPAGTEENYENPQSGESMSRPRIQPSTSQILSTNLYDFMICWVSVLSKIPKAAFGS